MQICIASVVQIKGICYMEQVIPLSWFIRSCWCLAFGTTPCVCYHLTRVRVQPWTASPCAGASRCWSGTSAIRRWASWWRRRVTWGAAWKISYFSSCRDFHYWLDCYWYICSIIDWTRCNKLYFLTLFNTEKNSNFQ